MSFPKRLFYYCVFSLNFAFYACEKTDAKAEETPLEKLASEEKKSWMIKKTAVEVTMPSGLINSYPLTLDCEIDDIWEFQKTGEFYKYENLTKCKGEPNELKVKGKWTLAEDNSILTFSNFKFLNNKEIENQKFNVENLTDSTLTISANAVFANTGKLTIDFKRK